MKKIGADVGIVGPDLDIEVGEMVVDIVITLAHPSSDVKKGSGISLGDV